VLPVPTTKPVKNVKSTSSGSKTSVSLNVHQDSGEIPPTENANHVTIPVLLALKEVTNLVLLVIVQESYIKECVLMVAQKTSIWKKLVDVANHVKPHVTNVTELIMELVTTVSKDGTS
jgi:hypothetical protein